MEDHTPPDNGRCWVTYHFEPLRKVKRSGIDEFGFFLGSNGTSYETATAPVLDVKLTEVSSEMNPLTAAESNTEDAADRRDQAIRRVLTAVGDHEGVRWWQRVAIEVVAEYQAAGIATSASRSKLRASPNSEIKVAKVFLEWAQNALMDARRRVRRGPIAMAERRIAWQLLSGALFRPVTSEQFEVYVARPIAAEHSEVILRDLGRTLPLHCLFKDESSPGQQSLRRLLHAYCARDPAVGYCQGMGFIAAVLLLHMEETAAFGVLWQLMQGRHYRMCQLFESGFPLLRKMLYILQALLEQFLPRLNAHFQNLGINPAFFASHWFLTLFAYQFPVSLVCRIWDLYFSEGWKIVFKVALTLLQWDEELLSGMSMENVLMHVKVIHEGKPPDEIIARAMALPIKERDLQQASPPPNYDAVAAPLDQS